MKYTKLVLAALSATSAFAQPEDASGKKNVLFLIVDDLRPELNCYGANYMKTPCIDSLASTGVMFQNAYCNVPVSGASRASIFSGLRPGKNRFWDVNSEIDKDAPDNVTLTQHFKENGYVTISNSKVIHGKKDAAKRSWSEIWMPKGPSKTWRDYLGDENLSVEKQKGGPNAYECLEVPDEAYFDGKTTDKVIKDLRELKKKKQPFFLAVGLLKPHLPFNAPKRYWDFYDRNSIQLPETFKFDRKGFPKEAFHEYNEIRYYKNIPAKGDISADEAITLIHGYRACVSYTDALVGKIMSELKRLDLDKNTLVVLLGDHGWSLGDHNQWCKHSNFNIVNHSPLIVLDPDNTKKGKEMKVVEFVDLYPTICEAAGLPVPKHVEGKSFIKLLHGEDKEWKDCAIIKWHNGVTYFDRNYGYTEWYNKNDQFISNMLFLYKNDRMELKNVANQLENKALINKLHKEIVNRRGNEFMNN
ncbi:MAG TPA: sulfatase [Macellibacteroides fermentans]|uniref:sulfatase n=1 Tax=Macellibacteroides fermentans TaxID=879969 RepID=UPI002B8EA6AE|nr:sulfatase [Macellibacteroides fermentans]